EQGLGWRVLVHAYWFTRVGGLFVQAAGTYLAAFFFSSRRRHTRLVSDWSSDVCSSDLGDAEEYGDDEQVDLKEAFGLPDQMAPLRLPAPPELAALARRAPLMAQLRRLAWWLGAGRAVTEDEELGRGDAAEAAARLGGCGARLP